MNETREIYDVVRQPTKGVRRIPDSEKPKKKSSLPLVIAYLAAAALTSLYVAHSFKPRSINVTQTIDSVAQDRKEQTKAVPEPGCAASDHFMETYRNMDIYNKADEEMVCEVYKTGTEQKLNESTLLSLLRKGPYTASKLIDKE